MSRPRLTHRADTPLQSFFTLPWISSAYAGADLRRRSSIRPKIFWNKLLGTATSANRKVTPWRTTLAPILTSFSRSVVTDQCSGSSGMADFSLGPDLASHTSNVNGCFRQSTRFARDHRIGPLLADPRHSDSIMSDNVSQVRCRLLHLNHLQIFSHGTPSLSPSSRVSPHWSR